MALFEGKPKTMQLHFMDNHVFEFRKLLIEDTFQVKKRNGEIHQGWMTFYRTELPFEGYGKLKPDTVSMAFDRDIVFDPFGLLKDSEKPEKGDHLNKKRITEIAESQRYKAQISKPKGLMTNTATMYLGIGLLIMILLFTIGKIAGMM